MPWQPLPRIVFAVATYPFAAQDAADLPLELGDELYIIEQGGRDGGWFRGYLVAPPSLLAGLTSVKGQTLEARVFSGIFPRSCVEVREVLGEEDATDDSFNGTTNGHSRQTSVESVGTPVSSPGAAPVGLQSQKQRDPSTTSRQSNTPAKRKGKKKHYTNGYTSTLAVAAVRDPNAPKPPAPVPMLKIGDETPTSMEEPLVDEIASCLREWHSTNLHGLLLSRRYPVLENMNALVNMLDLSRRQFLHNVLTKHELVGLREKTVWDLVRGSKMFNGEIIVRDPAQRGRVLTGDDSAVEITTLQSMMSLLDEMPLHPANENLTLHHLLLDVKTFVGASTESTTLVFYLASKTPGQSAVALSENYIVEVPPNGTLSGVGKSAHMRTLFTDLASADFGEMPSTDSEIYLVVKVQTTQQVTGSAKPTSRNGSRDGPIPVAKTAEKTHSSSGSKSGRRSLMWGQKSSRSYSKNSPITSKLTSLAEQEDSVNGNHGGPPNSNDTRGPAASERKSTTVSRLVHKTVGVGAFKINSVMKQDEEMEQVMTIWTPSTGFNQDRQDPNDWEEVIKDLMPSKSEFYVKSARSERLQVSLRSFDNPDADTLIKSTPTLLSEVGKTCKAGFSGAPTKPRSDIYVTIDEAFLPKHALLSRSAGSATPLSTQITGSHIQLTLEVRNANGDRIENCICASSNSDPISVWESTAAERGEAWNQTFKLAIPPTDVANCHLSITLSDVPNQIFAICYLPLWDQQAFMRDGYHSLLLYRYDETTSSTKGKGEVRTGYLSLLWNARGKDDVSKDEELTGPIATLRIQTYLCSTRFSQDKVLLGLLNWKQQPPGEVKELLKRLVFVPEIEIVKLLNDVFDAIFNIIVEHSGDDEYEDLVFGALVTVLSIVHDRRFNLGPLVDHYAENKFQYPFATPCLVRSFTRLLANPSDPETSRKLRATFKVVRHILKFITHARRQQKAKEADIGITSTSAGFTRHLQSIFKALDALMANNASILVGSQTLAVQHFHTWLPELTGLLTTEEILHVAIDFVDSCSLVKGKLILYKLVLIINYSRLELFSQSDLRSALSANTVRWIAPHWGKTPVVTEQYREQVRLCCSILSTQVGTLGPEIPDYIPKIIDSYLALQSSGQKTDKTKLSLLFPTTYPFPSKPISGKEQFDEVLIELSAILSAVSTLPAGMQLELAEEEMSCLLENNMKVHLSILDGEAFPANWLSVHIYHHKSTMKTLEYLASILLESFLPEPDEAEDFNTELWKGFFTVLLKLVGSDALALETFPEQKRRAVWKIAGDVREHGAELLRRTWEAIGWETSSDEKQQYGLSKMGGYQVQYVPGLVGAIVELCLSVHEGLRRVAVEVLQSMIVSEWTLSEDLSGIQMEMIDCLDHLFKSKPLTESILQKLFINELLGLFDCLAQSSDDLYASIKELIATIDEFLDLLVAVHSADGTGKASHMIHRLRLMEFLRDMQKEEIFIRYVHQLAQLQTNARNLTEAGLALRLHADLYEWEPTKLVPALLDPEFPAQSQFDRKERIYFDMIKNFEEGEAWSSALSAYLELQQQYQENAYDFNKLARTQRAVATIYEKIAKTEKIVPKYFRVTYRGMGFPTSLRDKEFVFEGSPSEKTSAFTDRMQEQHPSAQIVTSGDVDDVEGQFLQISPLSPYRDVKHHVYQRAKVSNIIRDYLLTSHPHVFSTTSKRSTTGPVTEHTSEKMIYSTAESFPTILRRSEIVSVDRVKLSAVQTALERIIRKTAEISVVEKRVADGEEDMAALLIDALQIAVNSNSESTVSRYRVLLPTMPADEEGIEVEAEVEFTPLETALKIALIDHAVLIKRCLGMFAKSQTSYMGTAERESLTQNFESTFAPELASFAFPQQQREQTPTPSWALASPVHSDGSRRDSQMLTRSMLGTSNTIGTQSVDAFDTSSARAGRSRLSFMKRQTNQPPPPIKEHEAVLAPIVNINGTRSVHGSVTNSDNTNGVYSRSRGDSSLSRGDSAANSPNMGNKQNNRMSFFSGGNLGSIGRGRGRSTLMSEKGEDAEWITQSDLNYAADRGYNSDQINGNGNAKVNGSSRRSSSSARPKTGGSPGQNGSVNGEHGGGSKGSVRKRFSMLKLGKKSSKASVRVGSVAEEE